MIDSIQTVCDPALGSAPGSVVQVRGCAHRLVDEAKERDVPIVLVGHVTKEGGLAGPRVLEHVVDTVLSFEGDRHHALRLLRASKHRFGPTNELGLFEMASDGLVGVPDASRLFLTDRRTGVAGSAVVPTLEGQRPLLVEVQALTNPASRGSHRGAARQGLDGGRLALLLAVLERAQPCARSASRRCTRPPSAGCGSPNPAPTSACAWRSSARFATSRCRPIWSCSARSGLAGELRQVGQAARRLAEAARLGFTRAIVPANSPDSDGASR